MNLNFKSHLKHLPVAAGAIRYARAVAFRFAVHETGALLCACAPFVFRAGEALQRFSDPTASRTAAPPPFTQSSSFEKPSSFDFWRTHAPPSSQTARMPPQVCGLLCVYHPSPSTLNQTTDNQRPKERTPSMTVTIIQPKHTTLYYREGSSDKVYHVSLEANGSAGTFLVRFAFGRRGSTLQTGTKTPAPVDYDTALRTYNQLVASKVAKGYTPGEDGTPYQHTGHEGRATGIYPQLLEPMTDTYALGLLLIDPLFCAQEKLDGKRLLLRKQGKVVEGINRKGLIVAVPETITREALRLPCDCLLDGEAVGDTFHVFDLLESGGIDHRKSPYIDRLGFLAGLIPDKSTAIQMVYTAHAPREKTRLYARLREQFKEGIVLKLLTAPYAPGKTSGSRTQMKYKFIESASFVVTLVHPTKRSVSLGLYAGSEIVDAGHVTIPPNHDIPKAGAVVEVRYLYAFRQSGAIYQPSYSGEREDIESAECTVSQLKYRLEPAATIRV